MKATTAPRHGRFELNDLYGVIFAIPSIILIYGGVQAGWGGWATAVGAGIATYGAIYFGFHDVIVHRRLNHRYIPKSAYMKRIVQAHRLHHALESKHHGLSFGFLVAPPIEELMVQLDSSRARLRSPTRPRDADPGLRLLRPIGTGPQAIAASGAGRHDRLDQGEDEFLQFLGIADDTSGWSRPWPRARPPWYRSRHRRWTRRAPPAATRNGNRAARRRGPTAR